MNFTPPPNKEIYYQQVWELARQVPHGKLATYGQLGQMIPIPAKFDAEDYRVLCSRWVGEAMAACPQDVPWHRVINSQGKISQRYDADRQKQLLEKEGHQFINGRLNLDIHQWGNEDAPEQASLF